MQSNDPMKIIKLLSGLCFKSYRSLILFADSIIAVTRYLASPYGLRSSPDERMIRIDLPDSTDSPCSNEADAEHPICLFAAHASEVSLSTIEYLRLFRNLGFRIVYINNKPSSYSSLCALSDLVWRAFDRPNMGQDIGAYKDGLLWLEAEGHLNRCTALAIVNDSMQFIPGAFAASMSRRIHQFLASDSPALFSHVSQQIIPHFQSFFQVLKPEVFLSRGFIGFWRDYIPYSHRFHCIYKGEIRISQLVYNKLKRVTTLYTSEALHERLLSSYQCNQGIEADDLIYLMPSPYRTIIEDVANPALDQLMNARDGRRKLVKSELTCITDLIEHNNPSHVAAFLYPMYLGCPLLKRDLCFAGSFTLGQAVNLYRDALRISLDNRIDQRETIDGLTREYAESLYSKGLPQGYARMRVKAIKKGLAKGFLYAPTFVL